MIAASPAAHAAKNITVDGHPAPVTLTVGETVTVRFEVPKLGDKAQVTMFRDVNRTGKFNTSTDYPFVSVGNIADGGGQDIDPAPGKVAVLWHFVAGTPAGQYLLYAEHASSFSLYRPSAVPPCCRWVVITDELPDQEVANPKPA